MLRRVLIGMGLGLVGCAPAIAELSPEFPQIVRFRVQVGDDPAWADPAFDDRDWPEQWLGDIEAADGVFWLRGEIDLEAERLASGRPLAARFVAMASCEMFWNGEPIGRNGTVAATAAGERPGALDWLQPLPPPSAPGRQAVALRCSAHRRGFDPSVGFHVFWVGDALDLADLGRGGSVLTLLSAGGLWAIGLFYVMTFVFGRRSRAHLWLGLFACTSGTLVIVESLRALVGYTYDLHLWRLSTIAALSWAINALLVTFVTSRFPMSGWRGLRWITAGLLVACLAMPGFDAKSAGHFFVGLAVALGWTIRAWRRGATDAGFAIAGLALSLAVGLWQPFAFVDFFVFFTLALLCVFLLASHVLADARERREHAATELRSARLEIELLRRHLQPHFLMNTLTALTEWFEEEPEVASAMVQDLGQEMRLLADVSSRSSIPLAQELDLCRSHLAVMARRRDEALTLDADGVDPSFEVPPAIVHTLLENALSHNSYRGEPACFRLRQVDEGPTTTFTFDAPFRPHPARSATVADPPTTEGTGLRYVRARLRESYGEAFRFDSRPATTATGEAVWRSVIQIPRPPEAG